MAYIVADRVAELSTSEGVGAFTLLGGVAGFRSFASAMAVADTCPYFIEALDANNVPSGAYEYGRGTYSAVNTLTRTTVLGSSNGGAAVAFAAGNKLVSVGVLAADMLAKGNTAALTPYALTLLDDVDAPTARTTLGAAALNGDGAQNFNAASLNGGQLAGHRNKIINGTGSINQRGAASVASIAGGVYFVDRWKIAAGLAGVNFVTADDSSVSLVGPRHLYLQTTIAKATLAAGDFVEAEQIIEGLNTADLRMGRADAKSFTVSFRAQASAAGVFTLAVRNSATNRSYVTPISIGTAAASYSVTIPGDAAGTWLTDSGVGLDVTLCFAASQAGTYTTANANVWQAGNFIAHNTQSNGMDTLNRSLSFSDVQLEKGTVATPFERRLSELALCKRYRRRISSLRIGGYNTAGGELAAPVTYEEMRAVPTITTATAFGVTNCSAPTYTNPSSTCFALRTLVTATGAAVAADGIVDLDAEL